MESLVSTAWLVACYVLILTLCPSSTAAKASGVSVFALRRSAQFKFPPPARNARKTGLRVSSMSPTDSNPKLSAALFEEIEEYLLSLNVGTPTQSGILAIFDTGSDVVWLPCGNLTFDCINCSGHYQQNLIFSPTSSASWSREPCGSPLCQEVHYSDNNYDSCTSAGCPLRRILNNLCSNPCPQFAYTYSDGTIAGLLGRDRINLQTTESKFSNISFGCVVSAYEESKGIVGFGKGLLSLPRQLGLKYFSHCFLGFNYSSTNASAPLIMGSSNFTRSDVAFTQMLPEKHAYYIGLESITLESKGSLKKLPAPAKLRERNCSGQSGGFLVDSGTTYTSFIEPFYSRVLKQVESVVFGYPRATDFENKNGWDLCYRVPTTPHPYDSIDVLPSSMTFHLLNNVSFAVLQDSLFSRMVKPDSATKTEVRCLLLRHLDDYESGPAGVLGNFQQHNVEVVYDLANEKIGFRPTDCLAMAQDHGL